MTTSQLPTAEQDLVAAVSGDTLMEYTRRIAQWVRLSGSEDEAKAFAYVADVCRSFGMQVELHQADALVSQGLAEVRAAESGLGAWGFIGAVVMTIFLRNVSGVTLLEKSLHKRREGYAEYVARTSPFVPRPPKKI